MNIKENVTVKLKTKFHIMLFLMKLMGHIRPTTAYKLGNYMSNNLEKYYTVSIGKHRLK